VGYLGAIMSYFIDILNIVLPVFAVIALGAFLKRIGLIDSTFLQQTNRLVYYVCLPLLLFYEIGRADFLANFNGRLVLGSILAVTITFLASYAYTAMRSYPPAARGVFSQGAFRGNIAYVGLAIVFNALGQSGLTRAGILMGFLVPFLNLYAILALLWPHRGSSEEGGPFLLRQIALNPLILASFAGIAWSFLAIPTPLLLERSLRIATGMTLPLALLAIGGGFSFERLRGDLFTAALAAGAKLVWMPILAAGLLYGLGVTGTDLEIGVLIAGTPAATANYIMAQQLKGDAELAGTIVMLSTLLSAVTYTISLLILRNPGL
jgi:predicted permease